MVQAIFVEVRILSSNEMANPPGMYGPAERRRCQKSLSMRLVFFLWGEDWKRARGRFSLPL